MNRSNYKIIKHKKMSPLVILQQANSFNGLQELCDNTFIALIGDF